MPVRGIDRLIPLAAMLLEERLRRPPDASPPAARPPAPQSAAQSAGQPSAAPASTPAPGVDPGAARLDAFLLQEHAALQEKMRYSVEDLYRTETVFVVAIAAFYAWVVKDGPAGSPVTPWLLFVPPLVAFVGLVRSLARIGYIGRLEKYLALVEAHFGASGDLGWERYYADRTGTGWSYNRARPLIWLVVIVATLAIAFTSDGRPGILI